MKFKLTLMAALIGAVALAFIGCGGGGASGVMAVAPKGDYYMVTGSNPAQKFDSPLYKDLADELDSFEEALENWEDDMDDIGLKNPKANNLKLEIQSEESKENINFIAGNFREDDLEDYFEDNLGWDDWDDDDANGKKFFTGKVGATDMAVMKSNGGLIYGDKDAVEDVIDVMTEGKKKMIQDKKFNEAKSLVDFNATDFVLIWDNMKGDGPIRTYKNLIAQVDDDEDLADAIDDLRANGISVYWTNKIRVVCKLKFKKDKHVETLYEFFKDDMDKFFEKAGPGLIQTFFGNTPDGDDMEDLADNARVNKHGTILELVFEIKGDELEDLVD